MLSEARNEVALLELRQALSNGRFMTATQISVEMKCAKPVAYARLRQLRERGCIFQTTRVRQSATGPRAVAYAIVAKDNNPRASP